MSFVSGRGAAMSTLPQTWSDAVASPTGDLTSGPRAQAIHDRSLEFERLLARELPRFQKMAMRWLRNREDAEDAVQDAVLSAFTHIAGFEGRARMSSWLMSIVINSVKMKLRKTRRKMVPLEQFVQGGVRTVAEMIADPSSNPEQSCQRSELLRILTHSIGKLSTTQRAALQLFELEGLSLKEAAQTLGVPLGTVKAQLARGRGKLGQKLKKLLGPRTRSCRLHSGAMGRTLQEPSRTQAASQPLPDSAGLTGREERLAHDSERTRVAREDICFAVMEVAVEGSPVPA
jgi:RNA polymerase sigma-70 factor (ECF subfamily)